MSQPEAWWSLATLRQHRQRWHVVALRGDRPQKSCLSPVCDADGADDRSQALMIRLPAWPSRLEYGKANHKFVARLAAERSRLQIAQVMRVGWFAAADQARLDMAQVIAVGMRRGAGTLLSMPWAKGLSAGSGFGRGGRTTPAFRSPTHRLFGRVTAAAGVGKICAGDLPVSMF